MDRAALAQMIDHTLLSPTATPGQVAMFCSEAIDLAVGAVCVSPSRLPLNAVHLPAAIATCTVIGFPSGAHRPETKAAEAAHAATEGADELDLVIDLGLATAGLWDRVEAEIRQVRDAVPSPLILKVIVESSALSDQGIVSACRAAEAAGADFVKTSTGFHPNGGATLHAVALMARTVDGRLGVKASGGIRDLETALAMIDAGATRLGCSATRAILEAV